MSCRNKSRAKYRPILARQGSLEICWARQQPVCSTDLHLVFLSSLGGSPALLPVLSCFYLDWHGNSILLTKKCQTWRNLLLPKLRLKRRLSSDERYFRQG